MKTNSKEYNKTFAPILFTFLFFSQAPAYSQESSKNNLDSKLTTTNSAVLQSKPNVIKQNKLAVRAVLSTSTEKQRRPVIEKRHIKEVLVNVQKLPNRPPLDLNDSDYLL